MFRIRDFARLSQVSVRTLHYYDQLGLLRPMQVDPVTGYRYYAAEQLPRLNRILALKDLGLSLEQIADLLRAELSPAELGGILRLKQVELQRRVQDEQARLGRVEARLRQIEQEDAMPTYEILLKRIEPLRVAMVQESLQPDGDSEELSSALDQLFEEVYTYLRNFDVAFPGPPLVVWHDDDRGVDDFGQTAEVAVPITTVISPSERVHVYKLPAVETMACTVHHGSPNTLVCAYAALHAWVASNRYRVIGPSRTISVHAPKDAFDSAALIEVQLPVTKEQRTESLLPVLSAADLALLTERAKQALGLAVEESSHVAHPVLDTGDLLIGLLYVEKGFAGDVLAQMGLTPNRAQAAIRASTVNEATMPGQRMTEPARGVFVQAVAQARQRGHGYVGTEHMLLALMQQRDGIAAWVLEHTGIELNQIYTTVIEQLEPRA